MYWKGMHTTIRRFAKSCRSCQVNKGHSLRYRHVPPKLVITSPWRVLCVDLVGPYTFKGKDGSSIDFMCLTMINPATSWFKIVELPTFTKLTVPKVGKGKKATCTHYTKVAEIFDNTSAQISNLVYKCWFTRYPCCQYLIYDNGSESKLHFRALCATYGIKRKPSSIKNPTANACWSTWLPAMALRCCSAIAGSHSPIGWGCRVDGRKKLWCVPRLMQADSNRLPHICWNTWLPAMALQRRSAKADNPVLQQKCRTGYKSCLQQPC